MPNKRNGVDEFKYFVGISSLGQIATRDDRVCVLNILGGESSTVSPISHSYSGGNIVFGTAPGKGGRVLATSVGDIPVYDNVLEGLEAGHRFNCGVVYLPPAAARDGVAELIRVNPDLQKIFIITEKISVRDAREIRAMGQQYGIDIFGANGLGVADSWNHVRIGGALGGDDPSDTLRPGSVAIFSNSGGFSTTIAQYLRMDGWGTSTIISSGKDVYIHYAAPEFAHAFSNDSRSKAAVIYCEPGGYYERDAEFTKPVIACVVGRWKSKLTRAVGHAGAMAGGSDNAIAKEHWFMERFGVDGIFTPETPHYSPKGALVTNIADIPVALTAVMEANGIERDFTPEGSLALKPWFGSSQGLAVPAELDLPVVTAIEPYQGQIAQLGTQIGRQYPRQSMKDASGASHMDVASQVSSLHGVSMLNTAQQSFEENCCLALIQDKGNATQHQLISLAIASFVNLHGSPALVAAQASRDAGNAPNMVIAAALAIVGPRDQRRAREAVDVIIETLSSIQLRDAFSPSLKVQAIEAEKLSSLLSTHPVPLAEALIESIGQRGVSIVALRMLSAAGHPTTEAVIAAIAVSIAWESLTHRRISRVSVCNLPWWFQLIGVAIGAGADASKHESHGFCGVSNRVLMNELLLSEVLFLGLFGCRPQSKEEFVLKTLSGLLLTNGPGAISAQGAKGAVSADGPEQPERVQLNKALVGCLTHTGFAHGGNGYEGIAYLLDKLQNLINDPSHEISPSDLDSLARNAAQEYGRYKVKQKEGGSLDLAKIPGINHPIFKGKDVNLDPREVFVHKLLSVEGEYNVFHEFYRHLVRQLFEQGVTRNVYCVNVDAVIAALIVKLLWQPLQSGSVVEHDLESVAFAIFLYPRMLGCIAEIEDHLNRGKNMDTRSPVSHCRHVV